MRARDHGRRMDASDAHEPEQLWVLRLGADHWVAARTDRAPLVVEHRAVLPGHRRQRVPARLVDPPRWHLLRRGGTYPAGHTDADHESDRSRMAGHHAPKPLLSTPLAPAP